MEKSLHNTCTDCAGNYGDIFKLISKSSSESEGWVKSTKAMQAGTSVVIQVTTQQRNSDGSYSIAEAVTTVPDAVIVEHCNSEGKVYSRTITSSPTKTINSNLISVVEGDFIGCKEGMMTMANIAKAIEGKPFYYVGSASDLIFKKKESND